MEARPVIISSKNERGFEIIMIPFGATHSKQLSLCPPGYRPGDEEFVMVSEDGQCFFDHAGFYRKPAKEESGLFDIFKKKK